MRGQTCILVLIILIHGTKNYNFPPDFKFGVATASYQIEGAWDKDGKGPNIWDTLTHRRPENIQDRSDGDIAADSYHKYKEDIHLMKQLGVDFYRFSISWGRILPNGHINEVNQAGIEYYDKLIDELLANGIQPVVTMFHWDLPQSLQNLGGLASRFFVDIFVDYARLLFAKYGNRVKWWITFNEPAVYAIGYSSETGFAPGIDSPGIGDYLVVHNIILAHTKTYHMYNQEFRMSQQGKLGITLNCAWYHPKTNSTDDMEAQKRAMQFYLGLHAHAIYSKEGDYPELVKNRIANRSSAQGFFKSRLPTFNRQEVDHVRGSFDFFGLNHYTTRLVTTGLDKDRIPSLEDDVLVLRRSDPSWPDTAGSTRKVVPWGFRKLLNWIKKEYNNPPVFVTENGVADRGEINDTRRIYYHTHYINELLNAIVEDGCNVFAYTAWSLIDNFEWTSGYNEKFGLYHVDYKDPNRTRTAKESAKVYAEIIHNRQVPPKYLEDE